MPAPALLWKPIAQPWKLIGFIWALPLSLFGFAWALILGAKWMGLEPEDWSCHYLCPEEGRGQKFLHRFNVGAQTLGSVIVYAQVPGAKTVKHERIHVRQGMKFGVFHMVFYVLLSLLGWAYGQDIYRGNDAEEQARYDAGQEPMPDDIKPKDHSGGKL